MTETLELEDMAKTRGRPKGPERNDMAVKVDRVIVGKGKLIATHRGITLAQLFSELLAGPVDRAYAQMLKELNPKG